MKEKLKIKLSIADRVYPLTIDSSQEEGLRSASKKIDEMIKQFEQSYEIRDKRDVLDMCAWQFASQVEQKQIEVTEVESSSIVRLENLDKKLSELLSK